MENKPKILVVEDETIIARNIKSSLLHLGYDPIGSAPSSREALEIVKNRLPDLVLMDIVLKDKVDGIDTAKQIQSQYDIPVIFITGLFDKKTFERAKFIDPYGYIHKPFDDKNLHTHVELALDKHKRKKLSGKQNKWCLNTLNSFTEGLVVTDKKSRITFANPAAQSLTGWKNDEIMGQPLPSLFQILVEDGEDTVETQMEKFFKGTASVSILKKVLLERKDGITIPLRLVKAAIKDEQQNLLGYSFILQDVSELAEEGKALKRNIAKLQKSNHELENFATIASHDLQEPLRKVIAFSERLVISQAPKLDEQGKGFLDRIQSSTLRMKSYLDGLFEYSKVGWEEHKTEQVDLDQIISEILDDFELKIHQSKARIQIHSMPKINADPFQIRQLFQNLISNALKFCKKGKRPAISIQSHLVIKTAGDFWEVTIKDEGIGFPQNEADRIFKPFERLHRAEGYEGSGIGLSICHKIVTGYGGTIHASSSSGKGTSITFALPAYKTD